MALLSDKFKLKPQLSGADVKSLYEAEADTNAYTDAEKTKLAGIASGAEVNVQSDWNAVSGDSQILNKPTLGTAAATDSTDYATAAQGALADTALQPDQAETISGNYTFNGAIILPNNSRINGVEHFYQTTKPTVRGDSSALVAGDRWWKTDDGSEWFWNGTYWLSATLYTNVIFNSSGSGTNAGYKGGSTVIPNSFSFLVKKVNCYINATSGTLDEFNYYLLEPMVYVTGGGFLKIPGVSFIKQTQSSLSYYTSSPNVYYSANTGINSIVSFGYLVTHIGAPTGGHFSNMEFYYHLSI